MVVIDFIEILLGQCLVLINWSFFSTNEVLLVNVEGWKRSPLLKETLVVQVEVL